MSVIRSRGPLPTSGQGSVSVGADLWATVHPGIWEMMTGPTMPDGSAREGSTLLVFWASDGVKICLNDRDTQQQAWVTARGVGEALEALERGLQANTLDWRAMKPYVKGRKSK